MRRGLDAEAPCRAEQFLATLVDATLGREWVTRVEVERHGERFDALLERKELLVVVILAALARVRVAIHADALQAELGDGALELVDPSIDAPQRDRGNPFEATRGTAR